MTGIPALLSDLPIYWAGVDDSTPDGCTLVATDYLGMPTTYVVRDGHVIGRIEIHRGTQVGYAGNRLKGGTLLGIGDSQTLAAKIAARNTITGTRAAITPKTAADRCGWNTGTAQFGPSRCGRPAKAGTDHPSTDNGAVCGIHARVVRSGRYAPVNVTYTVTPLPAGKE